MIKTGNDIKQYYGYTIDSDMIYIRHENIPNIKLIMNRTNFLSATYAQPGRPLSDTHNPLSLSQLRTVSDHLIPLGAAHTLFQRLQLLITIFRPTQTTPSSSEIFSDDAN